MSALESLPVHCWKLRPCLKHLSPGNGGANAILYRSMSGSDDRDWLNIPPINLIKDWACLGLPMFTFKILAHPIDKVIFENPFDELMEEVGGYQFMNVCMGKIVCKWLVELVKNADTEQKWNKTHCNAADNSISFPEFLWVECILACLRMCGWSQESVQLVKVVCRWCAAGENYFWEWVVPTNENSHTVCTIH